MNVFLAVALLSSAVPPRPSTDPAAVEAIQQLEQEIGVAMMRADPAKLGELYADDFRAVAATRTFDKAAMIEDFVSSKDKLEWFENGPMDVQVFGDIAMVHGSVKEKRVRDGKDTSGAYAWMDILERRNGKWLVKRSAGAKLSTDSATDDAAEREAIDRQQQELGPAMVAGDLARVSQTFADDWAEVGLSGKRLDKAQMLAGLQAGHHKLQSFAMSPLTIRVLGNVGLVQGALHEERTDQGKDTSGNFVFMDLVEKRDGRWVIVRSLGSRVQ